MLHHQVGAALRREQLLQSARMQSPAAADATKPVTIDIESDDDDDMDCINSVAEGTNNTTSVEQTDMNTVPSMNRGMNTVAGLKREVNTVQSMNREINTVRGTNREMSSVAGMNRGMNSMKRVSMNSEEEYGVSPSALNMPISRSSMPDNNMNTDLNTVLKTTLNTSLNTDGVRLSTSLATSIGMNTALSKSVSTMNSNMNTTLSDSVSTMNSNMNTTSSDSVSAMNTNMNTTLSDSVSTMNTNMNTTMSDSMATMSPPMNRGNAVNEQLRMNTAMSEPMNMNAVISPLTNSAAARNSPYDVPQATGTFGTRTGMGLGIGTCLDTGPRRRERFRMKHERPGDCAVCGEPANGMYFGAMVCLPCKSFFIRCTKEETPKFQCMSNRRCNIERGNRMRCQYCRFNRCLTAGMCRKEKPEVVEPGEGQELCRVCKDIANGIHFGVMTCEGCKKFFRRALKEADMYACKFIKKCALNPRNRNACRFCRYQQCLNVGMSRDAIRMGRPKKVKTASGGGYCSYPSRPYFYPQYSPGADSGFSSDSSRNTPDTSDFPLHVKKEPLGESDILEELLSNNLTSSMISLAPAEIDTDDINDILAALGQNVGNMGDHGLGASDQYSPEQNPGNLAQHSTASLDQENSKLSPQKDSMYGDESSGGKCSQTVEQKGNMYDPLDQHRESLDNGCADKGTQNVSMVNSGHLQDTYHGVDHSSVASPPYQPLASLMRSSVSAFDSQSMACLSNDAGHAIGFGGGGGVGGGGGGRYQSSLRGGQYMAHTLYQNNFPFAHRPSPFQSGMQQQQQQPYCVM